MEKSDLQKRLEEKMIRAAKNRDKLELSTLRMVKSAFHNQEIELKRMLSEAEALSIITSLAKQRKDSIEQFRKGNRTDLAEKEEQELAIIQSFMPHQLSAEEIEAEIDRVIAEAQAKSAHDMGKVMKIIMPQLTGKADGKYVSEMVKRKLSS